MSYSIRRPRLPALATVLGFGGMVAVVLAIGSIPTFFIVAAALLTAWNLWISTLVIAVDRRGVRFGGRGRRGSSLVVPWSSIRQVVVWNSGPAGLGGGEPEVGLRLRPDAPIPDALGSLIYDPNHPDEVPPSLRMKVRGLDRDRLDAAVQANGGGVTLVSA